MYNVIFLLSKCSWSHIQRLCTQCNSSRLDFIWACWIAVLQGERNTRRLSNISCFRFILFSLILLWRNSVLSYLSNLHNCLTGSLFTVSWGSCNICLFFLPTDVWKAQPCLASNISESTLPFGQMHYPGKPKPKKLKGASILIFKPALFLQSR